MRVIRDRFSYFRSLWSEGVIGRVIGLLWALYGVLAAIRDEALNSADAEQYRMLALIPHLPWSWWVTIAAVIMAAWVFEAAFKTNVKAQAKIANLSPANALHVIFDPSDPRCIRVQKDSFNQKPTGEIFFALVKNSGAVTITNITIRALPGFFTSTILAFAHTGRSVRRWATIHLRTVEELDPDATDVVELFGTGYEAELSHPDDVLNNVQRFTLECRARNVKTVQLTFEYDRSARPMLKAVK